MLYDTKWDTKVDTLPTFKPRWWYSPDRLDARPVMWYLRNRPEEWEPADNRPYWFLRHKPSRHTFRIAGPAIGLASANCDCSSRSDRGRFQVFQNIAFRAAVRTWMRQHERALRPPIDHEQFAAHFVRSTLSTE